MKASFKRTPDKGALIVVAYSNYLHPAIFVKLGPRLNPHFYVLERYDWLAQEFAQGRTPRFHVDYINRDMKHSIVSISPDELIDTDKAKYEAFVDLLKQNGKI